MNEQLAKGDLCMVVRDIINDGTRCYGRVIGTPVTLADRNSDTTWKTVEKVVCPQCKCVLPFLFSSELQKLRGPAQAADVDSLIGVDENGNGWRPAPCEVSA